MRRARRRAEKGQKNRWGPAPLPSLSSLLWYVLSVENRCLTTVSAFLSLFSSFLDSTLSSPTLHSSSYLNQNRVVVVCSARSGTTKSNGTTNLLLKAAAEARAPAPVPFTPGTSRDTPAGNLSRNPSGFFGSSSQFASSSTPPSVAFQRQPSLPGHLRQSGTSRSGSPSPFVALSSCNSLASSVSSLPETPAAPVEASFHGTVDQIKSDHFAAAKEAIKDEELLEELLYEIERDCEGLRGFLFAAQVSFSNPTRTRGERSAEGDSLTSFPPFFIFLCSFFCSDHRRDLRTFEGLHHRDRRETLMQNRRCRSSRQGSRFGTRLVREHRSGQPFRRGRRRSRGRS